ncbi:MAG TPA: efflux RND transporter permease subunit [Bryobacteraceae bacterium]|nr:efflux RND transporter permease subunit [Bryobacteraceae bacterium]
MSELSIPPPPATDTSDLHWTARHAKSIVFLIVTLAALGVILAFTVPVSVFPETNFPRVVIGVDNGVAPIDQMMVTVTRPIEEAVNTVQGLDRVWSITSRGSAEIDLFFSWKVNMFRTLELVNAALARVQSSLPPTAKITANRLTFAAFPIMGYSLTSNTMPQTRLWEMATYDLKPRLNRMTGVSTVVVQGGEEPEFQVQPDPGRLVQTSTTIPNILDAIGRSNLIDSPGLIEMKHQLVLGLVSGQARTPAQISDIVVKNTPAGTPVRIGDVASVAPSVMPVYTIVTANGKPSVLLNIYRQPDSNTVDVAHAVHAEIQAIQKELPKGVSLRPFYDQSEVVIDSIKSVRDAVLVGLVLASLIMVIFLRDWGTSLVAGLVIPATVAVTFIVIWTLGEGFDLMTLGGLAAAVGLVIDDAIVVVENIVVHRDSGQSRAEAIRSAIREVRVPLIGSTITPIVVFLPLISITGVTGTFFRALAITVGSALLASLALALTWTPTLSHFFIRDQPAHERTRQSTVSPRIMRRYERVLRLCLKHRIVLAAFALGLIGVSYLCYRSIGSDLLPALDEGAFVVDYLTPAGASLQETNRVISQVERILSQIPEVENTSRRTGLQLGLAAVTEANTGDISVKLKRKRDRSVQEVIADARERINKQLPTLDVEFVQTLQDMIGDLTSSPEPVVIKLFSEDAAELSQWGPQVADRIKKIPGVVDVLNGIENTISGPAIVFQVNQAVAARGGFTPQEVQLNASAIMQGEPAPTPVVVNDRAYTIRLRFPEQARSSLDAIQNTLLVGSTGKTATLGSLAQVTEEPGQTEIYRENLQRAVKVTGRFEGINLGDGMAKVQDAVAGLHLPASVRVEYGGQFAEQKRSFRDMAFVLVLAVVLVFIVLLFEFGSFAAPVAVLCSALLSTSGVFVALLLTGITFNLSSFMGLIMVIGIVAKNGILLLDADQKFRRTGMPAEQSMLSAGERRLRPIVMTALATVAGMIPLALAWGAGSEMLQPLAVAVIGGILASMVISLVVTPAVHYYLDPGTPAPNEVFN